MRTAFIESLTRLAAEDKRVTLVVGDLGFGVVTDFAERYPDQFINAGVSEQSMTGMAAGLALSGRIVFTYSIANFTTLRPLEQLRNDVCYHGANVVAVSVGGGFAYGALGMSHHATEDLAIMRSLPGMTVVAPGDPLETQQITRLLGAGAGPAYLRLGRAGEPIVHTETPRIQLGKATRARDGHDLTIISTGGMLATAVAVSDRLLAECGISVRVESMHTLKPLDEEAIIKAATETGGVVALEEHSVLGGLGGAVAEVLCEQDLPRVRLKRLGAPSSYLTTVGGQEHLLKQLGLDVDSVAGTVRDLAQSWRPSAAFTHAA